MLIQININIVATAQDLIHIHDFHGQIEVRGKMLLVLEFGEGATQGLDDAAITVETKYTIDFTESGK